MPRRRPGKLRERQPEIRFWEDPPPVRIRGLSARTSLLIHRVEGLSKDPYLFLGATSRALRRYRAFLSPPGKRPRYPQNALCSCRGCSYDDVRHARDVLDAVMRELPRRARSELGRRVAALDALYLRRTLPDPFAHDRRWRADLWWRRRLSGAWEGG